MLGRHGGQHVPLFRQVAGLEETLGTAQADMAELRKMHDEETTGLKITAAAEPARAAGSGGSVRAIPIELRLSQRALALHVDAAMPQLFCLVQLSWEGEKEMNSKHLTGPWRQCVRASPVS